MKGSVYKRCSRCGRNVRGRSCKGCGSHAANWAYRVRSGKDAQGRWIEQRRGGFPTRRDAERALAEIVASLYDGTFVASDSRTLGEFLMDEWLPATAPPHVRQATWEDRRRNLTHHVVSHIGDVALQQLNASHLNRLYAKLLEDGRVDQAGGLSPTTVRRIHAMIRKALNDAVRWGLVQRNVAELADPPPARAVQAARRRSMRTWSADEARLFLKATEGHPLHPLWATALGTGMRRSELLGLAWSAVNLERLTVVVRATVLAGDEGSVFVDDAKTDGSARTIHIDRRLAVVLRRHRRAQDQLRDAVGAGWRDHGLVFARADGHWWNPPAISLAFRRAVKSTGLPRIRFHDLRHSHASLLLQAGVNPKVVSERLGHSSVAFTLDTYAHVMPGMQPDAAELLGDLIYPHLAAGDDAEEDER